MSSSFILCNINEPFLNWIDVCQKVDFIWQQVTTSLAAGTRRSSRALPKATLAPEKRSWSLFGGLLPVWSTAAFWIPVRPLHLRSTLSKSIRGTKENCNTCSQQWQQKGPTTMPDCVSHKNQPGYGVLPHLPYSPDLSPIDRPLFKHLCNFLQRKCFHNQQDAEKSFQEFTESWSTHFYATGISKLTSCWQKCVDCNDFYFDSLIKLVRMT